MTKKYREYKQLNLTETGKEINKYWEDHEVFKRSLDLRKGHQPFIFYEGPPSANGKPGIHHVMARAIKDIFCRYKT
ncbi:MAG: class I tRNA ligase family protein, partial [Bacteroidales bacterium]|nr:class I tRNA ligase family protein [Bacteroidales bacterium]